MAAWIGLSACGLRPAGDGARGYRVAYLARKFGLSHEQARALIARVGHDRAKLNAAARALRAERAGGGRGAE